MNTLKRPAFRLIGLKLPATTTNEGRQSEIDCGNLWQKFISEKVAEQIPGKLSHETYAVYYGYEGDFTQPFSYFIGCKVRDETRTPEGLDSLTIPEQEYVLFVARGKMPQCIADVWGAVWRSEIRRGYQHDFEIYDERSRDWNNAEVDIFISVST